MTARKILVVVGAIVLASGCARWKDVERYKDVVWSDDDSRQAILQTITEEKKQMLDVTLRRDFRHRIFLQNADGSNLQPLTGVRQGEPGFNFYYMKTAGYVLVNIHESDEQGRVDLVHLNGSIETLTTFSRTECSPAQFVPSPDGSRIASIQRVASLGNMSCPSGALRVRFYDASTLAVLGTHEWPTNGYIDLSWTTDDELIVHDELNGTWAVDPVTGKGPLLETPECFFPKTTSSTVSAGGIRITVGDPVDVIPLGTLKPFGQTCAASKPDLQ